MRCWRGEISLFVRLLSTALQKEKPADFRNILMLVVTATWIRIDLLVILCCSWSCYTIKCMCGFLPLSLSCHSLSSMKNKIPITTQVKTLSITITAAQILEVIVPITTSLAQKDQEKQTLNSWPFKPCDLSSHLVTAWWSLWMDCFCHAHVFIPQFFNYGWADLQLFICFQNGPQCGCCNHNPGLGWVFLRWSVNLYSSSFCFVNGFICVFLLF